MAVTVKNERGQVLNALEERYDTDSVQSPYSRDNTACASIPQNPYFFLLPSIGLNPQTAWDSIGIYIARRGQ